MNGITGHAQNRTAREEFAGNVQATLGNETRETHGDDGMHSKGFVDDSFEVGKCFNELGMCDRIVLMTESFVELGLQLRLSAGVQGEVVRGGAGSARISISVNCKERR